MAKKRKADEDQNEIMIRSYQIKTEPETETEEDSDEGQEEEEEEEDLNKLLEPFNKEQLIDIIRTDASEHPKIIKEIHRVADLDPAHRKLFVHGLGWETTSEKLRDFFSTYGELEDCNVVVDKSTGKSKGYGFILFKHRRSAQKALKEPQKKIESRTTACQLASSGPVGASYPQQQNQQTHSNFHSSQDTLQRKIYVGNVHSEIPGDKLLSFFSKYGEIEEGPLGFDKQTGKPKGYALFIYRTVEGARKALEEPSKSFDGHQLYCQKATESHKLKSASASASVPASGPTGNLLAGDGYTPIGNADGFNPAGGAGFNTQNGVTAHQTSAALLGQGLMGGAQPFGQGIPSIQAALAVLIAAGQNPAAFGVSPAVMNPAFGPPSVAPASMQGFGMGNLGYQNPQVHQVNNSYQSGPPGHASATRPPPATGPMGGYVAR